MIIKIKVFLIDGAQHITQRAEFKEVEVSLGKNLEVEVDGVTHTLSEFHSVSVLITGTVCNGYRSDMCIDKLELINIIVPEYSESELEKFNKVNHGIVTKLQLFTEIGFVNVDPVDESVPI
jgi:hypothetical protein